MKEDVKQVAEWVKALNDFIKRQVPVQSVWGSVKSVDFDEKTFEVTVGDEIYFGVLAVGSVDLKKPKEGTKCLVSIIENKRGYCMLHYCEEIEEWHLNGDSEGGIVLAKELKKQLDKEVARIDTIIQALNNAVPAPMDGGAALSTSIKSVLATITTKGDFAAIESKTIKHG